jgi:hypothetical protein
MRAPQLWGNATAIPFRNPAPLMRSSPPRDTWRGLVEQWIAGTHAAPEIVTPPARLAPARLVGICALVLGFLECPPLDLLAGAGEPGEAPSPDGVLPPDGATAPPAPPAPLDAADPSAVWASIEQARQSVRSAVLTDLDVDRLWTAALATNHPFWAPGSHAPT